MPESTRKTKTKPKQWEYRIEYVRAGSLWRGHLEKLGEAGWEMCAAVATAEGPTDLSSNWPGTVMFYFKRPRKT